MAKTYKRHATYERKPTQPYQRVQKGNLRKKLEESWT